MHDSKTEAIGGVTLESKSGAGHVSSWQEYPYREQVQGAPFRAFAAVLCIHTLLEHQ